MDEIVKICGLSTREGLLAARDGGATHLGFIFFEKSPRHVTPRIARDLVLEAGKCKTVAVTVSADDAMVDEIVGTMGPDILQLHGAETVDRVKVVRERYGLPIMKAFAIREQGDLDHATTFAPHVDFLLFDAKPPKGSELPGGNGVSFDWSLIDGLQTDAPVLLSGGLDIRNLPDALKLVRNASNSLAGIDVSSGVESAPGVKDTGKIEAFLKAARTAEFQ